MAIKLITATTKVAPARNAMTLIQQRVGTMNQSGLPSSA